MILAIRTDSMEATIALLASGGTVQREETWEAGRALSRQLPPRIEKLLDDCGVTYADVAGVVVYQGPGSFTSLRIGITVANTIAHEQHIPIVGATGDDWIQAGLSQLKDAQPGTILTPVYGGEANISKPKK